MNVYLEISARSQEVSKISLCGSAHGDGDGVGNGDGGGDIINLLILHGRVSKKRIFSISTFLNFPLSFFNIHTRQIFLSSNEFSYIYAVIVKKKKKNKKFLSKSIDRYNLIQFILQKKLTNGRTRRTIYYFDTFR